MNRKFKLLPLAAVLSAVWSAQAQQVAYSPEMLRALAGPNQNVDISYFEKGFDLAPGTYRFKVNVNGIYHGYENIELRENNGSLEPVFRVKDIKSLALKPELLDEFGKLDPKKEIFPLSSKLNEARATFDSASMTLDISIPQIYLASSDGWVDVVEPSLWDNGETGAVINYNLTGNYSKSRQSPVETKNVYLNLGGRFNFGDWRLYTSGSFYANQYDAGEYSYKTHNWDLWNTYLQRDIPAWKGTLQIGELNTDGSLFETVPIRGVRISTNEQMLPYRDRTYSPIIEGIANTNAQIVIRQNGHVVYTINVAPGPFKLDNLPNFGNYGDLEVTIVESDGTERVMSVPNTSVSNMLREGQYRYDFNAGRYYSKSATNIKEPLVAMGTLSYGLPHDITVFGGTLLAEDYLSFGIGAGLSLGSLGAMTADVVQSHHRKDTARGIQSGSGAAYRVRYEKNLTSTGTRINLANYQYITGNFSTLDDYLTYGSSAMSYWAFNGRVKSRWQLSMSQQLGNWGSLTLGGEYSQYHGNSSDVKTINAGYYTSIKGVSVGVNYSRNYQKIGGEGEQHWGSSHTVMLNLNMPLSVLFGYSTNPVVNNNSVTYMGRMEKGLYGDSRYAQSVVLTGHDSNDWSWSMTQELGSSEDRSTSLNVSYTGSKFNSDFGVDHNHYANSYSLGLNGALVLHKNGVTLAPSAYDSIAVVEVPDASGVTVSKGHEVETDWFGNAVVSYLTNYTRNDIVIDPATLPDGALLLDSSNRTVIPTKGAIIHVKYPVRFGKQAVFVMKDKNRNPLPFGTTVDLLDEQGQKDPTVSGLVGEGGRVFMSGLPVKGVLRVLTNKEVTSYRYQVSETNQEPIDGFVPVPTFDLMPNSD